MPTPTARSYTAQNEQSCVLVVQCSTGDSVTCTGESVTCTGDSVTCTGDSVTWKLWLMFLTLHSATVVLDKGT